MVCLCNITADLRILVHQLRTARLTKYIITKKLLLNCYCIMGITQCHKSPLLRATEIPPPVALSAQRAHGPHRGDATDAVGQGKDGTGVACTKQQLLTINTPVILRGTLKTIPSRTWLNCHFRLGKDL